MDTVWNYASSSEEENSTSGDDYKIISHQSKKPRVVARDYHGNNTSDHHLSSIHDTTHGSTEGQPTSKMVLPTFGSLPSLTSMFNPSMTSTTNDVQTNQSHSGRKRTYEHIDGQWPLSVYLPVFGYKGNDSTEYNHGKQEAILKDSGHQQTEGQPRSVEGKPRENGDVVLGFESTNDSSESLCNILELMEPIIRHLHQPNSNQVDMIPNSDLHLSLTRPQSVARHDIPVLVSCFQQVIEFYSMHIQPLLKEIYYSHFDDDGSDASVNRDSGDGHPHASNENETGSATVSQHLEILQQLQNYATTTVPTLQIQQPRQMTSLQHPSSQIEPCIETHGRSKPHQWHPSQWSATALPPPQHITGIKHVKRHRLMMAPLSHHIITYGTIDPIVMYSNETQSRQFYAMNLIQRKPTQDRPILAKDFSDHNDKHANMMPAISFCFYQTYLFFIHNINIILRNMAKIPYYTDPTPHISLAWSLPVNSSNAPRDGENNVQDEDNKHKSGIAHLQTLKQGQSTSTAVQPPPPRLLHLVEHGVVLTPSMAVPPMFVFKELHVKIGHYLHIFDL